MTMAEKRAAAQEAALKVAEEKSKAVEDRLYAIVETMWKNKLEVTDMVIPIKAPDFNDLIMSYRMGVYLMNGKVRYQTDFGEIFLQVTA